MTEACEVSFSCRKNLTSLLVTCTCNLCGNLNCDLPYKLHIDDGCTDLAAACHLMSDLAAPA